jgi:hypothetical protein
LQGHLLYAWGAEVANGRVQKFRPRAGANPEFLVGKPVYAAWK